MEFSEKSILDKLYKHYNTHKYQISNVFMFGWESDLFSLTKSGYVWEFEIKISRADFMADSKKVEKHKALKNSKHEYLVIRGFEKETTYDTDIKGGFRAVYYPSSGVGIKKNIIPNRFFYAVPEGLIDKSEIPEYAGLVYVNDMGFIHEVKGAPMLHRNKLDLCSKLADKLYYRNIDLRSRIKQLEHEVQHKSKI